MPSDSGRRHRVHRLRRAGQRLYALDAVGGSRKWVFRGVDGFPRPPVVSGGLVYATDGGGTLYAFDAGKGTRK
ncbi:PQQ-binding-like beta-propeller repeat protein [Streptomyces sp. NBC_01500]|uniref:outer membrane protein assembly factor BamB family protein n=1 Tax=Streptomyces sp. NBC_01500 TaxID=2903886 RepID=UPI00338E1968